MTTWNGNPSLQALLVPLDSIALDPNNANEHNARSIESIERSYRAYGQQKPVIVTRQGKVLTGNGQVTAARNLGWTHVAATVFDNDNEALQKAFAIADNRTAEHSSWNEKLGTQLAELHRLGFQMEDTGFTVAEMQALSNTYDGQRADTDGDGLEEQDEEQQSFTTVRIPDVDLDRREDVRTVVEMALRNAGYMYEVKAL